MYIKECERNVKLGHLEICSKTSQDILSTSLSIFIRSHVSQD